MKVKETVRHSDGTTTEREFVMEMSKGLSHVSWTLGVDGEPIAVRILESGWREQGRPMYHVLTEYGDYEETSYSHLTEEQLLDRFPAFQKILDQMFRDIVVTESVIKSIPNDATLGKHVRKEAISK
jgi:hypothetical protein